MLKISAITLMITAVMASPVIASEKALIAQGEQTVRDTLLDGDSAKFRGVFTHVNKKVSADGPATIKAVCGQVNAKNQFGGYAGWQFFFSYPGVGATVIPMPEIGLPSDLEFWKKEYYALYQENCEQ